MPLPADAPPAADLPRARVASSPAAVRQNRLPSPGRVRGLLIYLVVAVANLFVDFSFVQRAEAQGLSAEGEWYAAFSIMLALVMVYIAMLRILAGRR